MAFQDYFGYRIVTKAMKISLSPKATIKYSKANILSVSPAASVLPVKKKQAPEAGGSATRDRSDKGDMGRQGRQGGHEETVDTWYTGKNGDPVQTWSTVLRHYLTEIKSKMGEIRNS